MKKGYIVLLVLFGTALFIKGTLGLFSLDFSPISNDNAAYDFGHNIGCFIDKIGGIAIGTFLLKLGYDKYCEEFKKVD
jgi:hypothetical protein